MVKAEHISNPRRILAVALEASTEQLSRIVKDLTGSQPEPVSESLAGTTHDLELQTPYYTATIPVWLDLVGGSPSEWALSFLSEEAKEVLEVLGGIVVVFAIPPETTTPPSPSKDETTALIEQVGRIVKEGLGGWEWDGVSLAVGVGDVAHLDDLDTWDELCGNAGLEFVHVATAAVGADVKNEFGEKVGVPRVREALESNDWTSTISISGGDLGPLGGDNSEDANTPNDNGEFDFENMDFGYDKEDFEGLKKAIWEAKMEREDPDGEDDKPVQKEGECSNHAVDANSGAEEGEDNDIRKVEQMMQKLQAVRDMSAGLPEEQRKRMAAKAVGEVMRDL